MTDYRALGQASTYDARLAAARASIALTFGVDWLSPRVASYLAPACERLDAFAGEEAYEQAGDEVDIMSIPTAGTVKGILGPALSYFRDTFPMDGTPPGRKYWLEVMRQARKAHKEGSRG